MTTSTKFKNSVFALVLASTPLLTVNNLALADSEASLQAGSMAATQNSDQSQQSSTSSSGTQNSAEASHQSSSNAQTQNESQATVQAGSVPTGAVNAVPSPAPFAVGREAQGIKKNGLPTAKATTAKPNANRAASVKAPKTKTVTYHWGRSKTSAN